MQKATNRTIKLVTSTEEEIFEKLVKSDDPFRKLNQVIDFEELLHPYKKKLYSDIGQSGIDFIKGFKCLLIQFWEDYSDRQMEKAVWENTAIKWFCGFKLTEETPDHTYFCKLRKRVGPDNLVEVFNSINNILRSKKLFGNVFKFIDASAIVSKTALWEERDIYLPPMSRPHVDKIKRDSTCDLGIG